MDRAGEVLREMRYHRASARVGRSLFRLLAAIVDGEREAGPARYRLLPGLLVRLLGAVGAPAQPAPVADPRSRTGRHQTADPGRGPVDRQALEPLSGVGSILSESFELDLPLDEVLRPIGTGHKAPGRKGTNSRIASLVCGPTLSMSVVQNSPALL